MHTNQDTTAEILLTQGYNMVSKAKITQFECDWTRRTLGCMPQRSYERQEQNSRHKILSKIHIGNQLGHLHEHDQPHQAGITHGIPWSPTSATRLLLWDHHLHQNPASTNSDNNRSSLQFQNRAKQKTPHWSLTSPPRTQQTLHHTTDHNLRLQTYPAPHRLTTEWIQHR